MDFCYGYPLAGGAVNRRAGIGMGATGLSQAEECLLEIAPE